MLTLKLAPNPRTAPTIGVTLTRVVPNGLIPYVQLPYLELTVHLGRHRVTLRRPNWQDRLDRIIARQTALHAARSL